MIPLPPLPPPEEPAKPEPERILPDAKTERIPPKTKPKEGAGTVGNAAAFVLVGGVVFVLFEATAPMTMGATRSSKLKWEKQQQQCDQQIQQLEADSNAEYPTSENSNP